MSENHWTFELVQRVALTDEGDWCSKSGLDALACLSEFPNDPDAQADFCGLLIDEIERLRKSVKSKQMVLNILRVNGYAIDAVLKAAEELVEKGLA